MGMLGFFTLYLRFEPADLHFWGPLAVNLGVVVSSGLKTIFYSKDRGLLRKAWNHLYGHEEPTASGDDEAGIPLMDRDGQPTGDRDGDPTRGPHRV